MRRGDGALELTGSGGQEAKGGFVWAQASAKAFGGAKPILSGKCVSGFSCTKNVSNNLSFLFNS
jgi:hypothetical protein